MAGRVKQVELEERGLTRTGAMHTNLENGSQPSSLAPYAKLRIGTIRCLT